MKQHLDYVDIFILNGIKECSLLFPACLINITAQRQKICHNFLLIMQRCINQRGSSIHILLVKIVHIDIDKWFNTLQVVDFDSLEKCIWSFHMEGLSLLPKCWIDIVWLDLVKFWLQVGFNQMSTQISEFFSNRQSFLLYLSRPFHTFLIPIISNWKSIKLLLPFIFIIKI